MRVAVGIDHGSQAEALEEAWKVFSREITGPSDGTVEFVRYDVSSPLPKMPLSVAELMQGAQGKVEDLILQLKREKSEADFYVGLEAGFHVVNSQGPRRLTFLEAWAYVSDGHRGNFGHSGGIAVPASISGPVIDRGIELGIVANRFKNDVHVSKQETWKILTRDILTSKHSFVMALIAAFAPFYNQQIYA